MSAEPFYELSHVNETWSIIARNAYTDGRSLVVFTVSELAVGNAGDVAQFMFKHLLPFKQLTAAGR